jgi:Transposase, Mutator family
MPPRVARGPRGSKPKRSKEQRRAQQQRVSARLQAGIAAVVQQVFEAALEAEVAALLGRDKYARRATAPAEAAEARCGGCGQAWRPRLWRAGSYWRTLVTLWAVIRLRVPRVACRCGHTVRWTSATLVPYARCWADVAERARELAGLCVSLRDARTVLAWGHGQLLACSTLQRYVHQAGALAEAVRQGPLTRIPAVVLLDGLWVTLLVPTGERYRDRTGRDRPRLRRHKVPLLVAYGIDPATGERWVLDWERAAKEDEAGWRSLLERLLARGLRVDAGFAVVISDGSAGLAAALDWVHFGPGMLHQRCVFHVLKTVREAVRGEPGMTRAEKRARRREVLPAAAPIWQATDRATVQRRWRAFRTAWRSREPDAVAALARAFDATLAYLTALERGRERGETWEPRYLRTTSALERVNRALRQKARQMGSFQAEAGVAAAVALVLAHRGLLLDTLPTDFWAEVLEARLLAS